MIQQSESKRKSARTLTWITPCKPQAQLGVTVTTLSLRNSVGVQHHSLTVVERLRRSVLHGSHLPRAAASPCTGLSLVSRLRRATPIHPITPPLASANGNKP